MALSRFTMTLTRDIAIAPFARLTVTIIGSISGVRPTATATANSKASSQSCLVKPLMKKNGWYHHQDELHHQPREAFDAAIECGRHAPGGDFIGELSEERATTRPHYVAGGISADDIGAHEAHVGKVEWTADAHLARMPKLLGGHRFAGQR